MDELEFEAAPSAEINDTTWLESEGQGSEAEWIYRVVSTTLHGFIFVMGLVGNIVLIFVVYKSRNLHTPTYTYLVGDLKSWQVGIIIIDFGVCRRRWLWRTCC